MSDTTPPPAAAPGRDREKHMAFGPIVCERCHVFPQMIDGSWCSRCAALPQDDATLRNTP